MNKRIITIIIAVLVIATAAYGATARNNNQNSGNNTSQGQSGQTEKTDTVSINNFVFSPSNITVKKGTMVTWTNNDTVPHTVTETDSKKGPSSGNLNQGDKYSFTFNNSGTFHYYCKVHPDMTGTVTVTD